MFGPLLHRLSSAFGAEPPRRELEISPATLPQGVMGEGLVRMHKVASGDLFSWPSHGVDVQPAGDIDLWIVPESAMPEILKSARETLAEEVAHAGRIGHVLRRLRFLASRAVLRKALSHHVGERIAASDWRFSDNGFGKPELIPGQADCSFSITHAHGFSVIAVARDATIGIDAERFEAADLKSLPVHCLSQSEAQKLQTLCERRRHEDFFRLWTLKEAYVKALGLGVSLDFSEIDFCAETATLRDAGRPDADPQTPLFGILNLEYLRQPYFLSVCLLGACISKIRSARKSFFIVEEGAAIAAPLQH